MTACRLAVLRQQALAAGRRGGGGGSRPAHSAAHYTAAADATAASPMPEHHETRDLWFQSNTRLSIAAPPVVYHPLYSAPQLAPGHRFPMVSWRRLLGLHPPTPLLCRRLAGWRLHSMARVAALLLTLPPPPLPAQAVFSTIHRLLLADGVVDPRQVCPVLAPERSLWCDRSGDCFSRTGWWCTCSACSGAPGVPPSRSVCCPPHRRYPCRCTSPPHCRAATCYTWHTPPSMWMHFVGAAWVRSRHGGPQELEAPVPAHASAVGQATCHQLASAAASRCMVAGVAEPSCPANARRPARLPSRPPTDEQRVRRIGFGEATRTRLLVDRTLAEVAGVCVCVWWWWGGGGVHGFLQLGSWHRGAPQACWWVLAIAIAHLWTGHCACHPDCLPAPAMQALS